VLFALATATGCMKQGAGTVRVRPLATSADEPANVAIYVGVTENGEPITDLDASSFRVYENDKLLPTSEIKTKLLPRELVTSEHVVLLVDLSGEVTDEERAMLAQAVEGFVRKLQRRHRRAPSRSKSSQRPIPHAISTAPWSRG
jgi:hypothetical protein